MFEWFWKKKESVESVPDRPARILHGHDLNEWDYLGYIELETQMDTGINNNPVFFFSKKDDLSKRSYKITGYEAGQAEKYHGFVSKHIHPWAAGEGEFYSVVRNPSDWLKDFMFKNFDKKYEWNAKKKWWSAIGEVTSPE